MAPLLIISMDTRLLMPESPPSRMASTPPCPIPYISASVSYTHRFIPLSQCHGHRIAPALCADFMGLLLQNGDCLLPGVAAGGCTPGLACFVVDSDRQPHLPPSVCSLTDVALVMPAVQGFFGCVFHAASSPFVTQRLPQVRPQSYSSDPTIFGFSFWALLTFCRSSQSSKMCIRDRPWPCSRQCY